MTEPDLILQQRNIARSFQETILKSQKTLVAAQAEYERETASAEEELLEAQKQLGEYLAECVELEMVVRSKIRGLQLKAFDKVGTPASSMLEANPKKTLTECKSELERILAELSDKNVLLTFVNVPSDVNKAAVLESLKSAGYQYSVCPKSGEHVKIKWEAARQVVAEMQALGITTEFAV